ncbi:hypothetical protein [Trueperella pyogenes]|uniref:hypothetical protein n=1 Tax=Trueperella pyogenes TaxID=1661 RepID=UPI00345CBC6D
MRRLLALLFVILALPAAPALAATSNDEPGWIVPDDVAAWFNDKAVATVRSHAAEAFPEASADDISAMTVGLPRQTGMLGRRTTANAIQLSQRWIAPILRGNDAVGAVSVDFASGVAGDEIVLGDERLAAAIARDEKVTFVWDNQLSAWFTVRESTIEPADLAGTKIILGAVPLTDFLAQRERLLSGSTPVPEPPKDGQSVAPQTGTNLPLTITMILSVLGLLIGSLVWLRSEQVSTSEADFSTDEFAAVERHGTVNRGESKMRFSDSGRKINVYKSPKAKDKNSSGLSND